MDKEMVDFNLKWAKRWLKIRCKGPTLEFLRRAVVALEAPNGN